MKSLIQFVVSWSLKCPRESYLPLFQLLLLLSQNSVVWMGHEGNGALGIIWYNWGSWVLTHMLSLPTPLPHEKSQAKSLWTLSFATLRGRLVCIKSSCPFYLFQCIQTNVFLLQWCSGSSPLETWTSTKILSSVGNCLRQCSLEVPIPWLRGARADSWATAGSTLRPRSLCLLPMHRWVSFSRVPWHVVLDPIASIKTLWVWMVVKLLLFGAGMWMVQECCLGQGWLFIEGLLIHCVSDVVISPQIISP